MGNLTRLLLAGTMLAGMSSPATADPLTIGVAILTNIGYAGAISGLGATILGSVVLGGAALGLSLVSNAIFSPQNNPTAPQQSDRQATARQSVGPRVRSYGRVKLGGTLWFFEVKNGTLYQGLTINEGLISGVVELWLNDQYVQIDGNGYVIDEPYFIAPNSVVRVFFRTGTSSQTVVPELDAAFDEVTQAHRLIGTAYVLVQFFEVKGDLVAKVYPQLNPAVRMVVDSSMLRDVRTGDLVYSDNPANVIYDYLTARDPAGFPYGPGFQFSQIDQRSFQSFAYLCEEQVVIKPGNVSIPRYRLWGSYSLNEEMRNVLPRMLATCDGDLYMNSLGQIAIRGGRWVPPALKITDSHIVRAEFKKGSQALAAFNELTITYTEPSIDFQQVEAERWLDNRNIALRGKVLSAQLDLPMVMHPAQARRLGKIHTIKNNPKWSGRIVTNFYGFNAINEQTLHLRYSPLGIDETFLIRSVTILPDMTGVEISVTSLSAAAYEWDWELEEGTSPTTPPDTSSSIVLDPPTNINVTTAQRVISGSVVGAYLVATWDEPTRTALRQEAEYRQTPGGTWLAMSVADGEERAESGIVNDGQSYEVHVRTVSPGGTPGDWSAPYSVTATADVNPPGPVTLGTVTPGTGQITITWTLPNSVNAVGARVYRNVTNNIGTATLRTTQYGSPGSSRTWTETGVAAGTKYYWIVAINGSGVEATPVPTGAQVIT